MTRIDFYILASQQPVELIRFTARLAQKALRQGNLLYCHTDNREQSEYLSKALWAFQPDSFLANELITDQNSASPVPILIGHEDQPAPDHHQVLINLSSSIPPFFSRFERVAEIALSDQDRLSASREHWKFYQERGYPLESHKL
jgi:DNA polymerase-3 subunit chi